MNGDVIEELYEELGEIWCLTFVRGVDAREALRRFGAYADTVAVRSLAEFGEMKESFDAGYPNVAAAVEVGGWAVVLEPEGFEANHGLLEAVSAGTEAVSVLRHDYASDGFRYSVDGVLVTGFDPAWPDRRWGTEPDRFGTFGTQAAEGDQGAEGGQEHQRAESGQEDQEDQGAEGAEGDRRAEGGQGAAGDRGNHGDHGTDDSHGWDGERAESWALGLAARIAGGVPSFELLAKPLLSAEFEPWFTAARPNSVLLSDGAGLSEAVAAATPEARRAVAVSEARRIAGLLGVAGTPGLEDVLRDAADGRFPAVSPESALGGAVRGWLQHASRASWSLNSARYRMSDAERHRGYLFGWFASALRGALFPDPLVAAQAALYPLAKGPAPLNDPAARIEVRTALRA